MTDIIALEVTKTAQGDIRTMKKSVIKAIFNGERGTAERMAMTEEEHKLMSVVSDTYDELLNALAPEQKNCRRNLLTREKVPFARN